jgi:hypothetical protein
MKKPAESPIPQVYFDGFTMVEGARDIAMQLTLGGQNVAILHASASMAKTFGHALEERLAEAYLNPDPERLALEEAMGNVDQTPER